MTLKKYTISLDGLLGHESIIFKLICSVSERTKNRTNAYTLTTDSKNSDINIKDIKNKQTDDIQTGSQVNVWVSDKADNLENSIARPLIATRVLHTLDNLLENTVITSDAKEMIAESAALESSADEDNSIEFNITEEEASELAIVHDEILENPANKEEHIAPGNIELTLVKNDSPKTIHKADSHRVLVVDDSQSVRKQLELELDLFDVTVDFADSAAAAFDLLKANTYGLALLDVVLPDKDGFQICKHIKSTTKETVAIMLTGKATQTDKIKGSLAGCDDYLIKPVGRITFQNAVKNYISIKNTHKAVEA
ncbi:MAG: response regulator [Gammaproteobacteria bacterium]|nr:response regulator [Gammaproteobacteria bacterium]MCW8986859.1 response regulator [Gammaproteobacteria bacterium]MCW9030404.1 response regulator [Gammaproteobacteria bacterium]